MHSIWRLVNMNLTEFFNTITKYGDGSFSIPVLKEFLTTPNTPDLTNFFDLYKQDKKLASAVDSKKYAKVIGKILDDHKSFGGDPATITSALQKNPDKMTISSMDIRNLNIPTERMHKFTINVSGVLLYDVVEKIYDFAKELNYELDMEIPAAKDQKLGYTDTIVLYSSNNNLFNTLDFIEKVKTISNSFGNQPTYREDHINKPFYAEVVTGIAYDSYNTEHEKWSRDLVGESIIEAIDNMIVNFIADHFELYGNVDYVNYKRDRVKMIRDMMQQNIDVYVTFNSYLTEVFKNKNIDPDNIYLSENVREKFLGPRVSVSEQLEEELAGKLDNTMDLERAIEEMTASLLKGQGDNKDVLDGENNPDGAENGGTSEENLTDEEENGLHFYEQDIKEGAGEELFSDLLADNGDGFVPLSGQVERISSEDNRVLGLNLNNGKNSTLNPLDYLSPTPTANLRRLDELNKTNASFVVTEDASLEQQQDEVAETLLESIIHEGLGEEEQQIESGNDILGDAQGENQLVENTGDSLEEMALDFGEQITVPDEPQKIGENNGDIDLDAQGENQLVENTGDSLEEAAVNFGEQITMPGESEKNGVSSENLADKNDGLFSSLIDDAINATGEQSTEEQRVGSIIGNIFGQELLDEIVASADSLESDETLAAPDQDRVEQMETHQEDVSFEKGEGLQDEEKEEATDIQTARAESKQDSLLKEFQKKRAAEISEMEEDKSRDELERLLKYDVSENMGNAIIPDNDASRRYLDQLLESAQSGSNNNFSGETQEETEKVKYVHIPTDEELRLEQMEQDLNRTNDGATPGNGSETVGTVVKSMPIEQGEAERFLDSLQNPANNVGFSGFDAAMQALEEGENEITNPISVFQANDLTGDLAQDDEKTPAAKKIEEMLAALEERKRSGRTNESSHEVVSVPRQKSKQEEEMDRLLASAMIVPERKDFSGFNEDMFMESESAEVNSAASLLGLSSDGSYQNYASTQQAKSEEEKRLDAMLNGEYKEELAVKIDEYIPAKVPEREISAEEREMDERLANLGKELPAEIGTFERPVKVVSYKHEPSEEEKRLDELAIAAMQPKPAILEKEKEEVQEVIRTDLEESQENAYLTSSLDMATKEETAKDKAEETGFAGFTADMNEPDGLEYAGTQGLASLSLEDKIRQVADLERGKNEEEERLNAMLRGEYKEKPAVVMESFVPTKIPEREISEEEKAMDAKLANLGKELPAEIKDSEDVARVVSYKNEPTEEEKRLDAMLRGEYEEEPAVVIESFVPTKIPDREISEEERAMNDKLANLGKEFPAEIKDAEDASRVVSYTHEQTEEEKRLDEVEKNALQPQPAIIGKEEKEEVVVRADIEESQENAYLTSLLNMATKEAGTKKSEEETGFTGFTEDMKGPDGLEYAGMQDLASLSLEDKIRQVADLERGKTEEEKRLDAMLNGEYKEEPAVVIEEQQGFKAAEDHKKPNQELYLDGLLDSIMADNSLGQDSDFTGFDEDMLGESYGSAVRTAQELFAEEIHAGSSNIEGYEEAKDRKNSYLEGLLEPLEDLETVERNDALESQDKVSQEDVELPKSKTSIQPSAENKPEAQEFNGFSELFFDDDQPEEEGLAAALAGESFIPLSLADFQEETQGTTIDDAYGDLTKYERAELLNMGLSSEEFNRLVEKYRCIFGEKTRDMLLKNITPMFLIDDTGEDDLLVVKYLEENDVLNYLPDGSEVSVDGKTMSREDFINDYLISRNLDRRTNLVDYLKQIGAEIKYNNQEKVLPRI